MEALAAEHDAAAGSERVALRIGDQEIVLEGEVRDAVLAVARAVTQGHSADVTVLPKQITTGQAADLLGVSRPTVVQLIERGELPATRVGSRRRLATADVLAFREARQSSRRTHLREVVAASKELGLYNA